VVAVTPVIIVPGSVFTVTHPSLGPQSISFMESNSILKLDGYSVVLLDAAGMVLTSVGKATVASRVPPFVTQVYQESVGGVYVPVLGTGAVLTVNGYTGAVPATPGAFAPSLDRTLA
jgi:hypothetical protein